MKSITEAMNWRYSTKEFDTNKKISAEDFQSPAGGLKGQEKKQS